ncbi:60S ribosomal protein L27 [Fukomys damarensis]|uniref:60S ribosomal protein L27 n=1 Tax=Fukomys damarensis TaxID=885580 RepID=A0A091D163_FUKDA|nr:60S ribosomal protein L27 [Fukomys damarensis]
MGKFMKPGKVVLVLRDYSGCNAVIMKNTYSVAPDHPYDHALVLDLTTVTVSPIAMSKKNIAKNQTSSLFVKVHNHIFLMLTRYSGNPLE